MNTKNKVAIVTGCSSGIGLAICKQLATHGLRLAIPTRNAPALQLTIANMGFDPSHFFIREVNIGSHSEVKNFIHTVNKEFGEIASLVNNAGVEGISELDKITDHDFDEILNINLKTPLWIIKEVVPFMIKSGSGRIVNISSQAGAVGEAFNTMYCATKFAIIGITQSLALELAQHNILVNAICPGAIDTEMLDTSIQKLAKIKNNSREVEANKLTENIPLSRLGKPSEVASIVSFLLMGEATYTTGSVFGATGGAKLF